MRANAGIEVAGCVREQEDLRRDVVKRVRDQRGRVR